MDRADHDFDKWYGIFSHFGRNGKRGIHLSISIFSGNIPVEWPEPFELPTENSGFCCQMVNGPQQAFSSRFADGLYQGLYRLSAMQAMASLQINTYLCGQMFINVHVGSVGHIRSTERS